MSILGGDYWDVRNKKNGYISLHRKFREHWLWKVPRKFSEAEAWIDMIMEANHKPEVWEKGNVKVPIDRAQFISSEVQMANNWDWTRKKVRHFLSKLESETMIKKTSTAMYTMIEIINYDNYQVEPDKKKEPKEPKEPKESTALKKPKAEKEKTDHQKVMSHFHDKFLDKFGTKPVISGKKDGNIIKTLLETYPSDRIINLLDIFFASKDPFIQTAGYTLGVFRSQINKLIVSNVTPTYKPPPIDPQIEELRRRQRESTTSQP